VVGEHAEYRCGSRADCTADAEPLGHGDALALPPIGGVEIEEFGRLRHHFERLLCVR
jgi:hypothetical protein